MEHFVLCRARPINVRLMLDFMDITAMGRPYSDPALPTTNHERVLALSTLSYKNT